MRVGASIRSFYPDGDARVMARWMVERAAAARAAELDWLFVGDHHATAQPYFQNVPILGRMLAEWGEEPFGALFLLPLWNPVLLAEQIGTLAALTTGRFIAQVCVGADPQQFRAIGAKTENRGATFESHFDVLRRLLAGEQVDGVGIAPHPADPVEYWIGAEAPVAIERAARLADAWMPGPNVALEVAAEQLRGYLETCEALGRPPRVKPIRRNLHVAGDERELERFVRPAMARAGLGFDADTVIVGTVDQVADAFREIAAAGFDAVIARHFMDEPAAVIESYARLGEVRRLVLEPATGG
jgi:alkanesulfonate monooxygenase SsuD/methylene tetrahydromethanopterin reductase-like flavin-dependent oxidoreductase (luciferase family)